MKLSFPILPLIYRRIIGLKRNNIFERVKAKKIPKPYCEIWFWNFKVFLGLSDRETLSTATCS